MDTENEEGKIKADKYGQCELLSHSAELWISCRFVYMVIFGQEMDSSIILGVSEDVTVYTAVAKKCKVT